ncbi:DUF4153 domain-containing protein [Parerythrobacter lacustris]|uniref:DUF4153 domain-containing protein n=1 Tax=Parerythrobacter lacustris TaxID=2969984 RepID=A0ABT1XT73_9SPHN|nr:DUF4153 domain-containing protein [Parerythrobacter lacustris]MCR2834833.1 DUF4153 domain-containing protein [Parerythrobacter lacustris]
MEHAETARLEDWPWRPWVLAALLGLAALVVNAAMEWDAADQEPWRAALAAFAFFGSLVLAVTLERDRWKAPLAFAGLAGLVMAGIAWRVASAGDRYAGAEFWLAAGVVATGLALPLFQAGFHRLRWRTSYRDTHYHVWTDAISAAGSLAFLGLSWLLLVLLSELFAAIKITFLRELMDESWFGWLFSGVAFGAALGTLRNQLKVIGTLQSVVLLVFSLIAVPFALALTVFLFAVLLSGIDVLWDATQSPTPLLLSCAAACFVLVNSVARDSDEEASANRVLRIAGLLLALGILPLAVMAAISTGTRIGQYGLSPERIWGLIAVAVAVAYGVAYFVAPIRGRASGWMAGWMQGVRGANMHLAIGTCVLALILALPLFDFGAISARDQIARLQAGKVAADRFDFDALRWDFGDAGRRALARLAKNPDAQVAAMAKAALAQKQRVYRYNNFEDGRPAVTDRFAVYPDGAELPDALRTAIELGEICRGDVVCRVYLQPDGATAAVLSDACVPPKFDADAAVEPGRDCSIRVDPYGLRDGQWQYLEAEPPMPSKSEDEQRAALARERRAIEGGDVRVAPSRERQIYIGEEPSGPRFE